MGEHAVALQRDGAAERLDGKEDLVLTERLIPGRHEPTILGVASHPRVEEDPGHPRRQQDTDREPFHLCAVRPDTVTVFCSASVARMMVVPESSSTISNRSTSPSAMPSIG